MAAPEQHPGQPGRWLRRHVLAGALAATVLVVGTGIASRVGDGADPAPAPPTPSASEAGASAEPGGVGPTDLLGVAEVERLDPRRAWQVSRTDANTVGDGLNTLCQRERFADAQGTGALVRTFYAVGSPRRGLVQTVEVSATRQAAGRAYRTVLEWYGGCRVGRLQLVDNVKVDGVGNRATVMRLRRSDGPVTTTLAVAVARQGDLTTSLVTTSVGGRTPSPRLMSTLLASAVARLCPLAGTSGCAGRPVLRPVAPPAGAEPGMLAAIDLPPVGRIERAWVGTRATTVRRDRPVTNCERAGFPAAGTAAVRARTFLVPGAGLPPRFGLTETYAVFVSPAAANRFVAGIRRSVAGCAAREPGTRVSADRRPDAAGLDLVAWDVATEVTPTSSVRFRLGLVRSGRVVARLAFTPSEEADMTNRAFDALLARAGERLREVG